MPIKDIEMRRFKQKVQKQKKRDETRVVSPFSPKCSAEEPSEVFFHDNRRFELLYDVMTLREMMMKRTNFNVWMNRHLGVLDELHLKKN